MEANKEHRRNEIDDTRICFEKRKFELKYYQQSMDIVSKGITTVREGIILFKDEPL